MYFWALSRGRGYTILTRSHAFRGIIPHFLFGMIDGWKKVVVIEYVPPKNQRWRTDFVLFFPGTYRVWEFRATGVHRCKTSVEALARTKGFLGGHRDRRRDS